MVIALKRFGYAHVSLVEENAVITLDVRIGRRDKDDDVNDWKELAQSLEERQMTCTIEESQVQLIKHLQ